MAAYPTSRQRTVITAAIAVAIIATIASYQVWHTYSAAVQNARRDIAQLVQIFEASSDATLQSLELIVDQAAAEVREQETTTARRGSLTERFIAIAEDWPFVSSVYFVGADGIARDAAVRGADGRLHPSPTPVDLSNREYFIYHRDTASQGVFLTDPILSNAAHGMAIAMTKKVRRADGSFAGVCAVNIKVDTLASLFAGLLPARYTGVSLFKRNGTLLVNQPQTSDIGRSFRKRALFTRRLAASTSEVYRIDGGAGGSDRLMAFNASPRYPVVITVSALWSNALASWTSASMILGASAATGILLIVAVTWWHLSRIRNEQDAQLALLENERNLMESQRLAGIGHFERDIKTNAYNWSENMFAMHGVSPGTFHPTRDAILELVAPEDRARTVACWKNLAENPASGTLEVRIMLPGGRQRDIRYGWRLLDSLGGAPARVFGIAQDMTPMRTAEATIRDDEQRLHDIVECSGDYIWESDAAGAISMITGGTASPIGFLDTWQDDETATPQTAASITTAQGDAATLREAIRGRAKFRNLVVPAADAAGRLRWVRVSANPTFDSHGHFSGYRGAGTDVTELRRQQERDEDRRKGEAIGRLAGGLAHEINNLLQPILIYAAFGASQEAGPADTRSYFSRIARAAEQATLIVKNVLTSSRKSPPVRESVNVREAIRETADLLGGTLPSHVSLSIDCDRDDLFARVDRTGLAQVLTNLVTNAAEALSEGGGAGGQEARIVVSAGVAHVAGETARSLGLQPGAYCRLSVSDTGPGIPREHLDKVFEPFFTTKPQGKGTGLGLSVVLGLARSWRGTVTVAGTVAGTTAGAVADAADNPLDGRPGGALGSDAPGLSPDGGDKHIGQPTRFMVYLPLEDRHLQAAQ